MIDSVNPPQPLTVTGVSSSSARIRNTNNNMYSTGLSARVPNKSSRAGGGAPRLGALNLGALNTVYTTPRPPQHQQQQHQQQHYRHHRTGNIQMTHNGWPDIMANTTTQVLTARMPKPPPGSKPLHRSAVAPQSSLSSTTSVQQQQQQQSTRLGRGAEGAVPPLTASRAVTLYDAMLTPFEKREIFSYDEIFYLGTTSTKARPVDSVSSSSVSSSSNDGYDDEHGDYVVVMHDHVAYRYEILKPLGRGSFGQVLKAHDYKTGRPVALKIIRNRKKFHTQALVEIRVLQHLTDNDPEGKFGCVRMYDNFVFRNHMCIVFELLHLNLYDFVKDNDFQPFSEGMLRKVAAQLLVSLAYLWRHKIVHCDIKPENILLAAPGSSTVRLIDVGSSCFESERIYTYIQSRFYRAPEVILGIGYTRSIDTWSLGCVLAELLLGFPIFPGESEPEQFAMIMECCGTPPRELIDMAPRRKHFFEADGTPKPVHTTRSKRLLRPGGRPLHKSIGLPLDHPIVSFIGAMLEWDPAKRIEPEAAMRHPWVSALFRQQQQQQQQVGAVHLPYVVSRESSARRLLLGGEAAAPAVGRLTHVRLDEW